MADDQVRSPDGSEIPTHDDQVVVRSSGVSPQQRIVALEHELLEAKGRIAQAVAQNERLSYTLREAREHISSLRDEIETLSSPPNPYGVVLARNDDDTVDIHVSGRKLRAQVDPSVDTESIGPGDEVMLNESQAVIGVRRPAPVGEVVVLRELLDDGVRAIVTTGTDDDVVCELGAVVRGRRLRPGDRLRLDSRSSMVLEVLPAAEVDDLLLAEVPDVSYTDIGGLDAQIEMIADAVELPYLHHELFAEHRLPAPKGILLYGPPGCGKTLIAKAVANSLARKVADSIGEDKGRSYFINIKGPELLNKYVGETERRIRSIFQRAREKSEEGWPVIVFFDEMDSMFRTRGSGVSSDMESTVVPQLLAEIDGVDGLRNVIVIGATNREDLIDPAILRPGRLDVKIRIERPDEVAASQILARYLTDDLPIADGERIPEMIEATVAEMYRDDPMNHFLEVTYVNGEKEILQFRDFVSGAMIENIVRRAKTSSIKRIVAGGPRGIETADLVDAVRREFREHEDLPNTTNPDDWAKVSGRKGERIVFIRTLIDRSSGVGGRAIERTPTGQYL
ncbi:MAG: proteasome ATPase [Actinomycetota bacterium]|nr:proteasome ATPase [Actinomycetota bacterium]MDA3014147.1 proteasome ATPase [Actinomycetota bacterium]MDA3028353.1 proteasome ATPase [Actinomycetota bacterium]